MIGLARSRLLWKINRSSLPNVYGGHQYRQHRCKKAPNLRYSKLDPYVQVSLLSHNRTRPKEFLVQYFITPTQPPRRLRLTSSNISEISESCSPFEAGYIFIARFIVPVKSTCRRTCFR